MKPIHPFPARMAPEIALKALRHLPEGATILDPMVGSGTVLREAVVRGYDAYGYDLDPLAVLISKVWTRHVSVSAITKTYERLSADAQKAKTKDIYLPWIDEDEETAKFIDFWFSDPQKGDLRRISYFLNQYEQEGVNKDVLNALRLALSRIVITKTVGASLAWDISHSRPHKVRTENDYDVFAGYENSINKLTRQLVFDKKTFGKATISRGDARDMRKVKDGEIDAVVTSPPYLNAIDYLRGHKFSLIWFGHGIAEIRDLRSNSIGAERGRKEPSNDDVLKIREKILKKDALPAPQIKMIDRYIGDAIGLMSEISRVLKNNGKAVLVVGNSCLKGIYIRNSDIFKHAGEMAGLDLTHFTKRKLPDNRYLPTPKGKKEPLGKRMKYEVVQTFVN